MEDDLEVSAILCKCSFLLMFCSEQAYFSFRLRPDRWIILAGEDRSQGRVSAALAGEA